MRDNARGVGRRRLQVHRQGVCVVYSHYPGADAGTQVKGAVGGHAHFTASTGQFCVKHYAGDVNYTAKNFCDRNKDTMSMDVVAHLQGASHKLVRMFFPPPEAGDEKRRPTTTAFKIKFQAQKLVKTLLECSPHYVRCMTYRVEFSFLF